MKKAINKYSCQLIAETGNEKYFSDDLQIRSPLEASEAIRKLTSIDKAPSEQLWAVFMNSKMQITGCTMVSSGDLVRAFADCRNVFRAAILANANAIILTHNHPSDVTEPSQEDRNTTEKVVEAGKLLGIQVLDHIIIGRTSFTSMKEENLVQF